jgi:hypothetical protein
MWYGVDHLKGDLKSPFGRAGYPVEETLHILLIRVPN